ARRLKRENRDQRRGQAFLPFDSHEEIDLFAGRYAQFASLRDDTPGQVREKAAAYQRIRAEGSKWWQESTACHLWTAAFFQRMASRESRMETEAATSGHSPFAIGYSPLITTESLRRYLQTQAADGRLVGQAWHLASRLRFFHWPLEFPDVFASGGFDVVLANPPWERIKLQEQEFFATRDPTIARAPNKAARQRLIRELPERNRQLWREFQERLHDAEALSKFLRQSGRFALTARGDINTYSVFAELIRGLLGPQGRGGMVVPTGIATDDTNKDFFTDLVAAGGLASLFDFENGEGVFPAVHRSYKFSLLTMSRTAVPRAEFAFFCTRSEQLKDAERRFALAAEDLALLNPNTRTCPVFRTRADAELTKHIYRRVPVLVNEQTAENPWGIRFMTMFHMANDSGLFQTAPADGLVPLYEGKFIDQFDHRHATCRTAHAIRGNQADRVTEEEYADPHFSITPRYWVPHEKVEAKLSHWPYRWLIGFRDVTRAVDLHTCWFSVLPRVGVSGKAPLIFTTAPERSLTPCLIANLNSFVLDYSARQKIGGVSLSHFIVKQLPVLPPERYTPAAIEFIAPRVLELVYTAWDLEPFAKDMGYDGPPFRWDEERRFRLRAELDAAFFRLYLPEEANGEWRTANREDGGVVDETPEQLAELKRYFPTPRDAAAYILETFPIVKRRDMEKFGRYRTKEAILEIYDAMREAIRGGARYRTRLDPPPADPGVAHPPREETS
ncbi:MAG: hypothetical protein GYA33_01585, partial [Thermogutta sp.]|nr:hypothetical protein [Thermogutta sp.]